MKSTINLPIDNYYTHIILPWERFHIAPICILRISVTCFISISETCRCSSRILDFLVYFALITNIPIPSYTHPEKLEEDKLRSGNENYELFCSHKVNGLAT